MVDTDPARAKEEISPSGELADELADELAGEFATGYPVVATGSADPLLLAAAVPYAGAVKLAAAGGCALVVGGGPGVAALDTGNG